MSMTWTDTSCARRLRGPTLFCVVGFAAPGAQADVEKELEEASREGEVQIRRQDGRVYAVTQVAKSARSAFANVTGRAVRGLTSKDLVRLAREEGRARGARMLRNARPGRATRRKRRTG
jgi:hypothetical protein